MKTTVQCGRCQAKIDIDQGCKIGTCYLPAGKKNGVGHLVVVDDKTPEGLEILSHIERKAIVPFAFGGVR